MLYTDQCCALISAHAYLRRVQGLISLICKLTAEEETPCENPNANESRKVHSTDQWSALISAHAYLRLVQGLISPI